MCNSNQKPETEEERIRKKAYQLWDSEGQPEKISALYWHKAKKQLELESERTSLKYSGNCIRQIWNKVFTFVMKNKVFTFLMGIESGLIFIFIAFLFLPDTKNFEGQLLVKEMGFTLTQSDRYKFDRVLIANVHEIRKITLKGKNSLILTGHFQEFSDPKINQTFQQSQQIKIELTNSESYLSLSSDTNTLSLEELRLQENTTVNKLTYIPSVTQLSLQLENNSEAPNVLKLNSDDNPLTLTLSQSCLEDTQTSQCIPTGNRLKATFKTSQIELDLEQDVNIEIYSSNQPDFSGDINVKDVTFEKQNESIGTIEDKFLESSIASGQTRIAAKEIEVKENQFLTIANPGIQSLRLIQIVRPESEGDSSWGLEVFIAGKTNSIQVALNKKFPITQVQISKLKAFPSYFINAWITLAIVLLSPLITWFPKD
ncbi:MAG: DUF2934 domain-containing protein [Spirulina sp.]